MASFTRSALIIPFFAMLLINAAFVGPDDLHAMLARL